MNPKPIAVFAGTPVDTKMGAECLEAHGLIPLMYPVSKDPHEQHMFQVSPLEEKQDVYKRQILYTFQYCQKNF